MRKLLKKLYIVQEHSNGKRRINPFNPLSYIALIIIFFVGIIMFGVYGVWKETDIINPFKWN